MIENIVIHTCCADCFINYISFLEDEKQIYPSTQITAFFYNPNIHPRSEYLERLNALKKVLSEKYINRPIKLVIPEYKPREFFESIKGKPERCMSCWDLRLQKTFEYAKEHNIPYFSTTLLSSHYQDADKIKAIGEGMETTDIKMIYPLSVHEQLDNSGFYKQNFCGCCYSLTQRMWEKYFK
jgi:predicted adenine nucleotide alpha hydrolase (AANH) superfamily ATPase